MKSKQTDKGCLKNFGYFLFIGSLETLGFEGPCHAVVVLLVKIPEKLADQVFFKGQG